MFLGDSFLEVMTMKKKWPAIAISSLLLFVLFMPLQTYAHNGHVPSSTDTLLYQDMLLLMLLPHIQKAVNNYYDKILTTNPIVYPYEINIIEAARASMNRRYDFLIMFEVQPVVGPHIAVGKDRITLELSPLLLSTVKINSYSHIETNELPPNWQHILRIKFSSTTSLLQNSDTHI